MKTLEQLIIDRLKSAKRLRILELARQLGQSFRTVYAELYRMERARKIKRYNCGCLSNISYAIA